MAFECLGDAQKVEKIYVNELVNIFKDRLAEAAENENLAKAFALVAADPRDRGKDLLEFVKKSLKKPEHQMAAAEILTLTNLPEAAEALAKCAGHEPKISPYLIQMGDLGVPALEEYAKQGQPWAMDALQEIGTPLAAKTLVPLLWDEDKEVPYHTAWRLAALLNKVNVESALRDVELSYKQCKAEQIEWIWAPFKEAHDSALPIIAGRIAHLLHTSPSELIPSGPAPALSPKLIIPLCTVAAQDGKLNTIEPEIRKKLIEKTNQEIDLLSIASENQDISGQTSYKDFISENLDQISTHSTWLYLFKALPEILQFKLLQPLIKNNPVPNKEDWFNVRCPSTYIFGTSLQARGIYLLLILLGGMNLWALIDGVLQRSHLWSWQNGMTLLAGVSIVIGILSLTLDRKKLTLTGLKAVILLAALGSSGVLGIIMELLSDNWHNSAIGIIIGVATIFSFAAINCNEYGYVDTFMGYVGIIEIMFIGVIIGIVGLGISVVINNIYWGAILSIKGAMLAILGIGGMVIAIFIIVVFIGIIVEIIDAVAYPEDFLGIIMISFIAVIIYSILFYLPLSIVYDTWNSTGVVLFWVGYLGIFILLLWSANRKQRRAQNPLHGLLDEQDADLIRPYRFRLFNWPGKGR